MTFYFDPLEPSWNSFPLKLYGDLKTSQNGGDQQTKFKSAFFHQLKYLQVRSGERKLQHRSFGHFGLLKYININFHFHLEFDKNYAIKNSLSFK